MVIADTSVWIPFFNRPESPEKQAIDALIDADRLALVGVVLAELLQGCRTPKEANMILTKLTGLRFLETSFLIGNVILSFDPILPQSKRGPLPDMEIGPEEEERPERLKHPPVRHLTNEAT